MTAGTRPVARLSLADLADLPTAVARPLYKRESLSSGIVHFGPGNFHRAHQAVYLDRLMNAGQGLDWAVTGVSVMAADAGLRQTLLNQDLLTTVVSQTAKTSKARVIGPMVDYAAVADTAAILARLTDPRIRIVSLTVTEGGYFLDAETGHFDSSHPEIKLALANPDRPTTVFGLIVKALQIRRKAGNNPFTVMSCDNLPHNGRAAREAVLGIAEPSDPTLARWIETNVSFPNGMVDRIAPATGPRERALIRDEHGVADQAPVFCEDYLQWVLEDRFVAGRPDFNQVGVQFVDDVSAFETMKIRILNGGHALIAYAAALLDVGFASEAMADPLICGFLDKVERQEILPVVPAVQGTDLPSYLDLVKTRFANPKIGDTVQRLCYDGSNRQPKFIVPTIRDQLAGASHTDGLALACALWCRYCAGRTDSQTVIAPNDPSWTRLNKLALEASARPGAWLEMRNIYGDLADNASFGSQFSHWLKTLWSAGTRDTLRQYLDGQRPG